MLIVCSFCVHKGNLIDKQLSTYNIFGKYLLNY